MAGIGFELKRLTREEGLLRPVASAGHGAIVAAGPWILTVVALSLIQRNLPVTDAAAYQLQALIIYVFCLSLLVTAPIVAAALRGCADDLYLGRYDRIGAVYLAALTGCAAVGAATTAAIFAAWFGFSGTGLLAACTTAATTSMIWPATAFCAAVRNFGAVTRGFVVGLAVAVVATLAAAYVGFGPHVQALAFGSGLGLVALWLTGAVLSAFPEPVPGLRQPFQRLVDTARRHVAVVLGAFLAIAALWIDSWIMWMGPLGLPVASGLPTAPFYDSAMFIARLAILPGLVLFLTSVDSEVLAGVRKFLHVVQAQGTIVRIEAQANVLGQTTNRLLLRLILVQTSLSLVVAVLAPALVGPAGLFYQQVGILRFGAMGALFHVIFFAATTVLLLLGRERLFLALQAGFLFLNGGATLAALALGPAYYGFGYLVAAACVAVLAMVSVHRALDRIVYFTFAEALRLTRRPPRSAELRPSLRHILQRLRRDRAEFRKGNA